MMCLPALDAISPFSLYALPVNDFRRRILTLFAVLWYTGYIRYLRESGLKGVRFHERGFNYT